MSTAVVQEELNKGTPPAAICAMCPWDRMCIQPPNMTKGEIDRLIDDAKAKEDARSIASGERNPGYGGLLTALMFGGRELQAFLCPVLALRLRTPGGRKFADTVRNLMQSWDDEG